MLVAIKDSYAEMSRLAARLVAAAVRNKPGLVLGLAAGSTPLGMYQELIRLHREEALDFSAVVTFNLDEYVGLSPDDPQSYHAFMREQFFNHVNVRPENVHIPNGRIQTDYAEYCAAYEDSIRRAGGVDLQILGIGTSGHIGFNERASSLRSRTRITALASQTLQDNRRFFSPDQDVPPCAITMGIGTILDARRIVLLATGYEKANAIALAIEGPVTSSVTASALQWHPDVTVVLDREAAEGLVHKEYYHRALELTARHTAESLW